MSWYGFPAVKQVRYGESDSGWPKADPVTAPKVDFTMEAWQRLAMERGDEIARLGELVKILEARIAYLEQLHSVDHL